MNVELSDQQRQALNEHPGSPLQVFDRITRSTYVLISKGDYDRVRALFEEDTLDPRELAPLMDEVAAQEGWDDSATDAYDLHDPRRTSP
jgi:hypothetical protein